MIQLNTSHVGMLLAFQQHADDGNLSKLVAYLNAQEVC